MREAGCFKKQRTKLSKATKNAGKLPADKKGRSSMRQEAMCTTRKHAQQEVLAAVRKMQAAGKEAVERMAKQYRREEEEELAQRGITVAPEGCAACPWGTGCGTKRVCMRMPCARLEAERHAR